MQGKWTADLVDPWWGQAGGPCPAVSGAARVRVGPPLQDAQ